jgi:thiamine pyrophosphate-dependent acetolactate synthase large subunit-like protein
MSTQPARQNVANRFDLTQRLVARLRRNEAVIGGIGLTNFDLWGAGHRPENFYMLGSMGLAVPIAHGVAIAQPHRRVIALEGDGSLLMQLGALGTVAARSPKNLVIVVWDNESYVITGAQASATATAVDLVAVAKASGIAKSYWALEPVEFERLIETALSEDGPIFIAAKVDKKDAVATTHRDPALIRENFMYGIGTRKNAFAARS